MKFKTTKQLLERERKSKEIWAKRLSVPIREVAINPDGTSPVVAAKAAAAELKAKELEAKAKAQAEAKAKAEAEAKAKAQAGKPNTTSVPNA